MVTRQLENMLGEAFRSPRLVREGLVNTTGRLSVEIVALMNPQLGGYSNSWLESVDYGFTEPTRNQAIGYDLSVSTGFHSKEVPGDKSAEHPKNSPTQQNPQDAVTATAGTS